MTSTTREIPASSMPSRRPSRLLSVLALIAAVIGAGISFTGWGILLPIAAIVLGGIASRREKPAKALWLTAILLGVVGLIVSIIFLFFQFLLLMALVGYSAG